MFVKRKVYCIHRSMLTNVVQIPTSACRLTVSWIEAVIATTVNSCPQAYTWVVRYAFCWETVSLIYWLIPRMRKGPMRLQDHGMLLGYPRLVIRISKQWPKKFNLVHQTTILVRGWGLGTRLLAVEQLALSQKQYYSCTTAYPVPCY